ncbi:MAG: hypothetical protein V7746_01920 [Halioglobus sp.]
MKDEATGPVYRKPYQPRQSPLWWMAKPVYRWYMIREGTAVFVALYSCTLLFGLFSLLQGEAAYNNWVLALRSPYFVCFHVLVLAAALYHAYTWFKLAPKIMVLRVGDWRLGEAAMLVGQWVGFVLVTLALLGLSLWLGR